MVKTVETDQFMYNEHARKPVIRTAWCLPQIRELYTLLQKKLIYIGLPGIESLDIKAWLPYLERVIAFQCAEYKEGRTTKIVDVKALDQYFESLEREGKILSGKVYEGFLEDIMMGGLSDRGEKYTQADFMKIYNLDFCNNLTTPREVRTDTGKTRYLHKLDAIEQLLVHQRVAAGQQKGRRFIMYVTVNANIFNGDTRAMVDPTYTGYFQKLKAITNPEVVAVRQMKAYCFYHLSGIFQKTNFQVEFLPPIFYLGSSYPNKNGGNKPAHHRMMTFTILGTQMDAGAATYRQEITQYLESKFVFASDARIQCYTDKHIAESDFAPDPVEILRQSHSYVNLWRQVINP